jgi:hypothetical protein
MDDGAEVLLTNQRAAGLGPVSQQTACLGDVLSVQACVRGVAVLVIIIAVPCSPPIDQHDGRACIAEARGHICHVLPRAYM